MYLCLNCYEKKPDCKCKKGTFVSIDKNIIEIISLLNKKGYETQYCCGGHITKESVKEKKPFEIYISFNKDYNFNIEELGEGWIYKRGTLRYYNNDIKKEKKETADNELYKKYNSILDKEIKKLKFFTEKL